MRRKKFKKSTAALLAMLLVLSTCITAYAASVSVTYYGSIYSYISDNVIPDENLHGKFTTSEGKPAFCAEHGMPSPMGDIYGNSTVLNKVAYDDAQIRKVLYYGYRGVEPWYGFSDPTYNNVYKIGFSGNYATSKTDACGTAVTSMALGRAYGGDGRVYNVSGLAAFESYIASKPDPKANGFTAYLLPSGNKATQDLFTWEYNPKGYVMVKKTNASNSHLVAECPEQYSFAGAKFGVYANQSNAENDTGRLATVTTDANGNSDTATLNAGNYYVREVEAPKGYRLNKTPYPVTVTSGRTSSVTIADEPRFDPLNIKVTKKPVEGSDKNLPIEGAEYTIKYYKQLKDSNGNKITTTEQLKSLKPYRTWVIRTDKNGRAALFDDWLVKEKSDSLYIADDGMPVGLHGTYSFEETLAPQGFAKTDRVWIQQADFDSKLQNITSQLEDITDNEKPQTVSITINKVDAETGKNEAQGHGTLAGAKYDVFFYDPIKSEDVKVATLTTDEKGFARYEGGKPGLYKVVETKASNGYIIDKEYHEVKARITEVNTANFDYVVTSKEKPINVEIEKTSIDENGLKITVPGATLQLLDANKRVIEQFKSTKSIKSIKGLKPGKYYIHEVKAPEGYFPLEKDFEFEVKATDKVQSFEVFNEPVPEIKTDASFEDGVKNNKPSKSMEITDSFAYKKVLAGEKYIIKGKLIDKATGKAIAEAEKEFTPKESKGSVKVNFKFDGSKYKDGAELVVTEKLYRVRADKSEKLVATHEDLTDLNQTVNIPKLKTTATDKIDDGKDLNAAEKQTIVDKVQYTNLFAGKEYTVKGVLMNKATGKPILVDGKQVTAEKTFTPKETSGYVDLEFTLDASALKGETIVVFENLYEGKIEVGSHTDITDNDQSIYIPKIHTTATAQIDDGKELLPVNTVVVSDKVEYENLIKGQMYEMRGSLVNTKSKEIIAKATGCFVAEKDSGHVTLDFEIDATDLKGKNLVVFEELYKLDENGDAVKEVAEHSDITDKGQTVRVIKPEIETTATSKDDGSKDLLPVKEMTIVDKVEYTDLVIDKEYTVKGILMDKETEKPLLIDGKEVTAEKTFTATEKDGFVELEFTFDANKLKGKEIVVFEDLFYKGQEIATHSDITDEGQTVEVENPEIGTTANFANGKKEHISNDKMTIVDKVEYKNLVEGKEYTVKGILMDKETGKPFLVDGKKVTVEKKFTAKNESGFVEVEFKFDGSGLKNKELVVYEGVYYEDELIALHMDIDDEGQTVKVLPVPPTPKTGDTNNTAGLMAVLSGALATLLGAINYRRKNNSR